MASIQWTDELSVKIPSIDNQHKTLVGLINKLDDAVNNGNSKEVLKVIIKELVRYTQAHFIYEEALFNMHGYPESDNHQIAHKKLFEKVEMFKKAVDEDQEDIYNELLDFLNNWLYRHILKEDMAYSSHLVSKGAE